MDAVVGHSFPSRASRRQEEFFARDDTWMAIPRPPKESSAQGTKGKGEEETTDKKVGQVERCPTEGGGEGRTHPHPQHRCTARAAVAAPAASPLGRSADGRGRFLTTSALSSSQSSFAPLGSSSTRWKDSLACYLYPSEVQEVFSLLSL